MIFIEIYKNFQVGLKDEFYLDQCFFSTVHAQIATKNAIQIITTKDYTYL